MPEQSQVSAGRRKNKGWGRLVGVAKVVRMELQKDHQRYTQGVIKTLRRERVANAERPQVTQ